MTRGSRQIRCAMVVRAIGLLGDQAGIAADFGSWYGLGDMMEQQLRTLRETTDAGNVPVSVPACGKISGMQCSLPLGKTMVCGNKRHSVDRASNSELILGGAPSADVWLIRSGILRLQRYSYEGRRQILSLFFAGEIVGFEGEFRDGVSVETATPSSLCRIDRRRFDSMVDHKDALRAELFRQKQDQLDRLHWLTWSLGALGPEERLSAFLALSSKFMPYQALPDGTGILSVRLPRKDIADLLGTTVETISRILSKLSETGVIEIRDLAHLRFLDLPRLIEIGQIKGLFDRMSGRRASQRDHIYGLVAPSFDSSPCFCGPELGPLTSVNDPQACSDIHAPAENQHKGGTDR